MKTKYVFVSLLFMIALFATTNLRANESVIDLSGTWNFALDPNNKGIEERWFERDLTGDTIPLPGTTDIARKGRPNDERLVKQLTRRYKFVGKAWYQREIDIPESWKDRRVLLTLERTKASTVWLDGIQIGEQQLGLSAPHRYIVIDDAKPGKHRLTVMVDNNPKLFPANGHQIDEDIQTNWNGIIGEISLKNIGPVRIEALRLKPNIKRNAVDIAIQLENGVNKDVIVDVHFLGPGDDSDIRFQCKLGSKTVHTAYFMPKDAQRWTEWNPVLYKLETVVKIDGVESDRRTDEFGMRELSHDGHRLLCNGEQIFLRGKHDALAFPLTGAPPTDVASWEKFLGRCKEYGMNHIRYHSCCPPKAAFVVADRLGIYMQAEPPSRGRFADKGDDKRLRYQTDESKSILDEYGNHASFFLFTLGNELHSDRKMMGGVVKELREYDGNRRLFAYGSNNFFNDPKEQPGDDVWITFRTTKGAKGNTRASYAHGNLPLGHIETGPPNTRHDFSSCLNYSTIPVVGHETGQFQVSPNYDEISRYTGVLEARNLEIFADRLKAAGMFDQWKDFFEASSEAALLCYKEEIEAALRTKNFAGFQLLDLQDFQAQGTALVGVLDAFMEPKSDTLKQRWNEFCADVVPLACFDKYVWTEDEVFKADIKIANYGPKNIDDVVIVKFDSLQRGYPDPKIKKGGLTELDTFTTFNPFTLRDGKPATLKLEIAIGYADSPCTGRKVIRNSWPIYVMPKVTDETLAELSKDVVIVQEYDEATVSALEEGKKVLLLGKPLPVWKRPEDKAKKSSEGDVDSPPDDIGGVGDRLATQEEKRESKRIKGLFMTDFWCYPMFKGSAERKKLEPSPGTLGMLCDPSHPIFEHFPTERHTTWLWWHLIKNSNNIVLDAAPKDFQPIVQMIDNFARNHKIGMIFECKVGQGKLLACCIDEAVLRDRPEGRQLLLSMLSYMNSDRFDPQTELSNDIFNDNLPD